MILIVKNQVVDCVYTLSFVFRIQRKVVSLCVYRNGDSLELEGMRDLYDSINTLVMHHATAAVSIPIGDHEVLAQFRYPVH